MHISLRPTPMTAMLLGSALALTIVAGPAAAASLDGDDAEAIFAECKATAQATRSPLRSPDEETNVNTVMWCAVIDREGVLLLIKATDTDGTPNDPNDSDAWRGSAPIAIAKAWTALAFSSSDLALDSRTIGLLARPDVPGSGDGGPGTDTGPAPLFGIGDTNLYTRFFNGPNEVFLNRKHQGIVTFAGGQPVYDCTTGELLGGVGVSGDGVDEDDTVAQGAVLGADFCLTPEGPPPEDGQ